MVAQVKQTNQPTVSCSGPVKFIETGIQVQQCPSIVSEACFCSKNTAKQAMFRIDQEFFSGMAKIVPPSGDGLWTTCQMVNKAEDPDLLYKASLALGLDASSELFSRRAYEEALMKFAGKLIELKAIFSPIQIELGLQGLNRQSEKGGELADFDEGEHHFFVTNGQIEHNCPPVSIVTIYRRSGREGKGLQVDYYPLQEVLRTSGFPGGILHLRNNPEKTVASSANSKN